MGPRFYVEMPPHVVEQGMKLFLVLALLPGTVLCAAPALPPPSVIDARVATLMKRESVNGLAIAVVDGGQVTHLRAFGYRNRERGLPLTTDTVMYGASVTKAAFACFVLKLVDEGRLDLDAPLEKLLARPLTDF